MKWILKTKWSDGRESELMFRNPIDATRHKESMDAVFGDDISSMTIERSEG